MSDERPQSAYLLDYEKKAEEFRTHLVTATVGRNVDSGSGCDCSVIRAYGEPNF